MEPRWSSEILEITRLRKSRIIDVIWYKQIELHNLGNAGRMSGGNQSKQRETRSFSDNWVVLPFSHIEPTYYQMKNCLEEEQGKPSLHVLLQPQLDVSLNVFERSPFAQLLFLQLLCHLYISYLPLAFTSSSMPRWNPRMLPCIHTLCLRQEAHCGQIHGLFIF